MKLLTVWRLQWKFMSICFNSLIYFFRYINSKDVKRIAKMLGFRATKDVFDEMISMYSFHFL